jgi:protein-S-isoprenylcysteine O-methyltransferase Ste14
MAHDPHRGLITLLWVIWALFWLISARGLKAVQRSESVGSRLTYLLPAIIGGVLLAWRAIPVSLLAERLWPRSLLAYWIGVALLAAGIAFAIWARVHLGRNWSGTVTVKEGHELIRTGPYALVRHPIYTGLLTAVIGTAIASGTVRALFAVLIITISLVLKLRTEERFMREAFPAEYQRYCAQVPALVPFTKLRRSAPR